MPLPTLTLAPTTLSPHLPLNPCLYAPLQNSYLYPQASLLVVVVNQFLKFSQSLRPLRHLQRPSLLSVTTSIITAPTYLTLTRSPPTCPLALLINVQLPSLSNGMHSQSVTTPATTSLPPLLQYSSKPSHWPPNWTTDPALHPCRALAIPFPDS